MPAALLYGLASLTAGALVLAVMLTHLRPMTLLRRAFHAYEAAALARPIITKSLTSGVAYTLGDVLAQHATRSRRASAAASKSDASASLDSARVARSGVAGLISHGPQLHVWSLLLDRYVDFGPGRWAMRGALVAKIVLDQTFFSLYMNAAVSHARTHACSRSCTATHPPPTVLYHRR